MEFIELPIIQLEAEYQEKQPLYTKLCSELVTQLNELMSEAGVSLAFPIEYRVKTWKSIYEKCLRKILNPKEIREIPDIAGIRIILLFKHDLDKACEIIERNFEILQKEDALQRLGPDKFGYGSIHYELLLDEKWLSVPSLRRLRGLQAEVQVRTASQHIWATVSHLLQYKQESDVPVPIRRSINRAAAILEIVDLEFERLLNERENYLSQIESIDENETLNTDTLRHLLDKVLPEKNKLGNEDYAELLKDLRLFKVTTVRGLKDIITRNWDSMIKEEEKQCSLNLDIVETERQIKGVYFNHMGLVREALRSEFGTDFDNYMHEKYMGDISEYDES
jgi:putative GTP pyrophosphokinase